MSMRLGSETLSEKIKQSKNNKNKLRKFETRNVIHVVDLREYLSNECGALGLSSTITHTRHVVYPSHLRTQLEEGSEVQGRPGLSSLRVAWDMQFPD